LNFFWGSGLHLFVLEGRVLVISSPSTPLSACVSLSRYMICCVTILSFISTKVDDLFIHVRLTSRECIKPSLTSKQTDHDIVMLIWRWQLWSFLNMRSQNYNGCNFTCVIFNSISS
jgi:hypothetical protein